jgi:hypothetical protein
MKKEESIVSGPFAEAAIDGAEKEGLNAESDGKQRTR